MPEEFERKLAAILAPDIARYSALMEDDEEATVRDLKAHQAVILPLIAKHGGHIIDTADDGILAEYPSIVNAVECAVALQNVMAERNAGIPAERQMRYRVGVNLGDVMHDKQRVYGDGVRTSRLVLRASPSLAVFASRVRLLPTCSVSCNYDSSTGGCWHPSDNLAVEQSVKRS